jgi:hypothetical protein
MTFLPCSKELALVAMVTSQPLCIFPYSKLHAMTAIALATDFM